MSTPALTCRAKRISFLQFGLVIVEHGVSKFAAAFQQQGEPHALQKRLR
jgi:hypothetical protein